MKTTVLTIHTATYNRAYILGNAYQSLLAQTCHDFEWIVSDDGSTDNTEELVKSWVGTNPPFKIIYEKLPHGGKCRALNSGVNRAAGRYFFMLDSDDVLTSDAVECILSKTSEIDNKGDYVGVGFLKVTPQGLPVKGIYPKVNDYGYVDCTNKERRKYDLDADMCEAYKTDIIKRFPFPVWPSELFAPEQLCLDAMALAGYKLRWHIKSIYICEYRQDGLTKGAWELQKNNKMGYAMLANQRMLCEETFKQQFKSAAEHIALSILGKNPSYIFKSNNPWLTFVALPYALALTVRRHWQFRYHNPAPNS